MGKERKLSEFDVYKQGLRAAVYFKGKFYFFSAKTVKNSPERINPSLIINETSKSYIPVLDLCVVVNTYQYKGNLEKLLKC